MTTQRVKLDVLTNYCDLDTVIAELERLREQYNGRCMVDVSQEPVPYTEYDEVVATLEIRE